MFGLSSAHLLNIMSGKLGELQRGGAVRFGQTLVAVAALLLSSCAPHVPTETTPFVVDPGQAQVTLFRDSGGQNFVIKVDAREVGKLAPSTYMMLNIPAGKHLISAEDEMLLGTPGQPRYSTYELEAVGGERISLHLALTQCPEGKSLRQCKPLLEAADEQRAQAEIQKLRRVGAQ